jgi:heme-degrading monooxygenase HmoA
VEAMIFEIAEIEVKPNEEEAFEAAVAKAEPLFRRAKGCHGMELQRTIEKPLLYRLVVKWETVEDHMVHSSVALKTSKSGASLWGRISQPHMSSCTRAPSSRDFSGRR